MNAELKPCPFCGGESYLGTVKYSPNMVREQEWDQDTFYKVNCVKCGANNLGMVGYATEAKAAEAWNGRAAGPLASISTDGPHAITDTRQWLARQLLDSKLSDQSAFSIVAHAPSIKAARAEGVAMVSAPLGREVFLADLRAWFDRTIPATEAAIDYLNEDGWDDAKALHVRLLALSQQDQVGLTTPAVLGEEDIDGLPSRSCADGSLPVLKEPPCDLEDIGPPTPLGALRFRMEQGGHTQNDLAKLIGTRARASEILSGKRALSKAQIATLADAWGIPARSLLGDRIPATPNLSGPQGTEAALSATDEPISPPPPAGGVK